MRAPPPAIVSDKPVAKFKKVEDILKDPLLKAKLNNCVDEAVRCKQRIFNEQQSIKDLRDVARNDVGINPKLFSYYVSMVFNNDYAARKDNVDQLDALITAVMALGLQDDVPGDDE